MGISRVNAGVKVLPELKESLRKHANQEDKTVSKLGEVLLEWAVDQLDRAGNTIVLKTWVAGPVKTEVPENPVLSSHSKDDQSNHIISRVTDLLKTKETILEKRKPKRRKDSAHSA